MVSTMLFLIPIWAFLPLLAAQEVPPPCALPFIYNQTRYSSCTKDGRPEGKLWCATTRDYDKTPDWKYCNDTEYGGEPGGEPCVFPFIYHGETFYTCTNKDEHLGKFWCATTGNYDKDGKWSYCADTRLQADKMGPCVFPFIYEGKSYSTCTTAREDTGKLWCSLTKYYDSVRWTYCDSSEIRPCHFPFIFNGKTYHSCTSEGASDGQLWCATTAKYDKDSKWRPCALEEYEGSSKGKSCVFPFIFKAQKFYTCTNANEGSGRFWCATTRNYDEDKKWSYCADTRVAANAHRLCMFPFLYNGKYYTSCTSHGSFSGRSWCSLTSNYDQDFKWDYCDLSGPNGVGMMPI